MRRWRCAVSLSGSGGSVSTVGVDLSSSPRRTATVSIEWSEREARVGTPVIGPGEDDLARCVAEAEWAGIAAPFGWPEAMVAGIHSYATGEAWPGVEKEDFRYRRTDRFMRDHLAVETERRLWPLSPSSDRIALTVWRLAGLRERVFERSGRRFDCAGGDRVVEVYPTAAWFLWGLEGTGYKVGQRQERREETRSARVALIGGLEASAPWLGWVEGAREVCEGSDDALDAVVCALVARAASLGFTVGPPVEEVERAESEGWIHLPHKGSLSMLVGQNARVPAVVG